MSAPKGLFPPTPAERRRAKRYARAMTMVTISVVCFVLGLLFSFGSPLLESLMYIVGAPLGILGGLAAKRTNSDGRHMLGFIAGGLCLFVLAVHVLYALFG